MKQENKALRDWYIKKKEEIASKYNGEISSPDYKREIANLANKFYREKKKLQPKKQEETTAAPRIPFNEDALSVINDPLEQEVIKAHLANVLKSPTELAKEIGQGLSSQMITAILNREEVKSLVKGLLWGDISLGCEVAIRDGVARKDPAWIKIAHEYSYVQRKGDCNHVENKPISDPKLQAVLITVGDFWGDPKQTELVIRK